jgi:hypothetical protein
MHPFLVLVVCLITFSVSVSIGCWLKKKTQSPHENSRDDFKFVLGGILTLLALIIGFTFSMAVERYDLRKNYEEQEANAIGTEYVRADLLPSADAGNVRSLLTSYLAQRIENYKSRDLQQLRQIEDQTARLQSQMWSAVTGTANAKPTAVTALAVAGMNDVLNTQGYTQAAWWNRVPIEAWALLIVISICCNIMIGYGAWTRSPFVLLTLPIVLSISLFLIADMDSPRRGLVRVRPQNLQSLAESLHLTMKPTGR